MNFYLSVNWRFIILMVGSVLLYQVITAQPLQQPLRKLGTRDGLPQSFISGLVQDEQGFVWIGTRNGIARFDGIRFKIFEHGLDDDSTISSNLILCFKKDRQDKIWVEYEEREIDIFDPLTGNAERITQRPLFKKQPVHIIRRGWISDINGNLWCAARGNGLYQYNWNKRLVQHFSYKTNGLPSDTIRGLLMDKQNMLWVLSQRGLSKIDPATGAINNLLLPYQLDFNTYADADAEIVGLCERANGEIVFGDRKQLVFYQPGTKTFRSVSLPGYPKFGVQWMQTAASGTEYLESAGIVYRYDDGKGLFAVADARYNAGTITTSFLIDRSGFMWLGTNGNGVLQVDLTKPFFEAHPVEYTFHRDLLNKEFGIHLEDFSAWPLAEKDFHSSSYYFRSVYDVQGRLWMALRDRVGWYDVKSKKYAVLPPVPNVLDPEQSTVGIRGISFSPSGRLWVIGNDRYIGWYDTEQNKWISFNDPLSNNLINSSTALLDLLADDDKLWITTNNATGLLCIDINSGKLQVFSRQATKNVLPAAQLLGLHSDPTRKDILWIGSYEGLISFNKNTFQSTLFSIKDGLPDNTIYSIESDNAGFLWLSTNKGLCRFDPVKHTVNLFQTEDGLPGDEFNRFHHLKLPDGRLAFGGMDGWVLFNPTATKTDHYQPSIAFTGLKVNNLPVDSAVAGIRLSTSLNVLKELNLAYNQNTLTFDFAGMQFSQPKKLQYRYQLDGYDNDWIYSPVPVANYTKLPPGHYTLKINATNTTGEWSSFIRELPVTVRPPFWNTWWAWVVYAFFIAFCIRLYIRFTVNRDRLQQQVLLKQREAAQLKAVDELKSRFFSNITHDFRTPLTLILGPAQELKNRLVQPLHQRWLANIERNANQLLRLINQLLDLSKLDSGTLKLEEHRVQVAAVINEVVRSFSEEAISKEIDLSFEGKENTGEYMVDANKLEQVVSNLVANAVKFTPARGKVAVHFYALPVSNKAIPGLLPDTTKEHGIIITVSDTGAGIAQEQLPYIFDRYYQADTGKNDTAQAGSGIGLSLVKELVELQGGKINVTSNINNKDAWSSIFYVWLPLQTVGNGEILPADEMIIDLQKSKLLTVAAEERATTINNNESEEPTTLLLVEDNAELADFIMGSIKGNYTIVHAVNGAEGLQKAFELIPDIVISDVMMPVMDGFEFCNQLKRDERTSHVPVILLTAKATFDDRIQGLQLGADDYLTKPFHLQELQLRVENMVERQEKLREHLRRELNDASTPVAPDTAEEPVVPDAFIEKLHLTIEANLDKTAFGVEEIAREIGMSRANLHRKLKAISGMAAGEIIRNYRLKRAKEFLRQGHNSSETAYMTGFDSPAYFSKSFKDFFAVTPTEFIKEKH